MTVAADRQPPGWFVILRPQPKDLSCAGLASSMGGDASLRLSMTKGEVGYHPGWLVILSAHAKDPSCVGLH